MIDEDFRTLLLNTLPTGTAVEKGKISEEQGKTRVWFQRSAAEQDLDLDATAGLQRTMFDVEIGTLDENVCQTMALQLKAPLLILTTLNGTINASVTSFTVASAGNIPANGLPFTIQIDAEKMSIAAIAGAVLTVTRGYASTTAASHLNGANVTCQGLHGFRGTVGGTGFLGVFIEDHSDEYESRLAMDADEGYQIATFRATAHHL